MGCLRRDPTFFCFYNDKVLTLISRIAVVTGEIIAVVVSWKKAIGTVRQAIRYDLRLSLSTALVQNGTVLFLGLLALNIYQILTYTIPGLFALSSGDPFVEPLPAVLMSRFILNLKQAAVETDLESTVNNSTLQFSSNILVGNMGESLDLGDDPEPVVENHSFTAEMHNDIECI
ncbi:hypothetical protein BDY19DRAFT_458363 [Irpex rosettiformis]|uniref:Uncharacterized protein n=1 Tax=Irpex rosettiformis TaxID=378272 RepID=A0ACB8TSX9_9APHY|nr:hypothetical protein BDY19DRAFT_458363 [Irpex rosettiformis]